MELSESLLRHALLVSVRHDFNDGGAGDTVGNGNAINVGFDIPHLQYAHGYVEMNTGANSALSGGSSGPTFKGSLWLTFPISRGR